MYPVCIHVEEGRSPVHGSVEILGPRDTKPDSILEKVRV